MAAKEISSDSVTAAYLAAPRQPLVRTPEEAFEAGRRLARERGTRLSPAQAAKVAAILHPFLDRIFPESDGEAAA